MKNILTILALLIPTFVVSDQYYKAVNVTCAPEVDLFEVYATGVANVDPVGKNLKEKYGLYFPKSGEKISFGCEVSGNKINTEIQYDEVRPRGACGGNPGGTLYISINGKKILHHIQFDQSCYPYTLTSFKLDRYNLTICGKLNWSEHCRIFGISTLLKSGKPLNRSIIEIEGS